MQTLKQSRDHNYLNRNTAFCGHFFWNFDSTHHVCMGERPGGKKSLNVVICTKRGWMQERRLIQLLGRAVGCVVNADAASLKYCDRSWFRAPARVMFDNWHTECGTSLFLEVLFIILRLSSCNFLCCPGCTAAVLKPTSWWNSKETFNETLETT